eukprot:6180832-Pleurochrysis_carterae.AAC.1
MDTIKVPNSNWHPRTNLAISLLLRTASSANAVARQMSVGKCTKAIASDDRPVTLTRPLAPWVPGSELFQSAAMRECVGRSQELEKAYK